MKVSERLKEYTELPDDPKGCVGYFRNEKQFRLELRHQGRLICWVHYETLHDIGKKTDDKIRQVIGMVPNPVATLYADFFFSGWRINRYLKTGKQAGEFL